MSKDQWPTSDHWAELLEPDVPQLPICRSLTPSRNPVTSKRSSRLSTINCGQLITIERSRGLSAATTPDACRTALFALVVGVQQFEFRELRVVQPRETGHPLLGRQRELRGDGQRDHHQRSQGVHARGYG